MPPKAGTPKTDRERLAAHYGEKKAAELLKLVGDDAYRLLPPRGSKVSKELRLNVEKAALNLLQGETLNEYLEQLRASVSSHLKAKFALGEQSWIYTVDVFEDAVVAEVNRAAAAGGSGRALYQMPYSRGKNGFSLGEPVEVVRRVAYAPKKASVQKREGLWSGVL